MLVESLSFWMFLIEVSRLEESSELQVTYLLKRLVGKMIVSFPKVGCWLVLRIESLGSMVVLFSHQPPAAPHLTWPKSRPKTPHTM